MKLKLTIALLLLTCLCLAVIARPANAYTFNPNDLIDDGVFYDTGTMGIAQIDSFLNQFPNSCISTNSGFSAPDVTGYQPSPSEFFYSSTPVTAGTVIYHSAQVYGLNPQVLLTTMQKEEGIVDGSGPYGCGATAMASALGYGCTDSGTNTHNYTYPGGGLVTPLYYRNSTAFNSVTGSCVNSGPKAGFSEQIIHAAWLLRFGQERSKGDINWSVQLTNYPYSGDTWDNSDDPQSCYGGPMTQGTWQRCPSGSTSYYDGYTNIDNSGQCAGLPTSLSVHMDTGATAALYWYTPHICGNYSFFNIFTNWFGSTIGPDYQAQFFSQSPYPTLVQGDTSTIYFSFRNNGRLPWGDDVSASGFNPVHLATITPLNRNSVFTNNWPSSNRPVVVFSAVYESDGTTLASDQHVVNPGQIAKFSFSIRVPLTLTPGTYQESFMPIREGADTWWMGDSAWIGITVKPLYAATNVTGTASVSMKVNDEAQVSLRYRNDGSASWYDDTSAQPGASPIHLATSSPVNRTSTLGRSWASTGTRPALNFTHVYESDGTTLAANQHVVNPGQIAQFSFMLTAPIYLSTQTLQESFQPIIEGYSEWDMGGQTTIPVAVSSGSRSAQFYAQSAYPTINRGSSSSVYFSYKNTGDTAWYDDSSAQRGVYPLHVSTSNPINRADPYADPSWISNNRPAVMLTAVYESDGTTLAANQNVVNPGQIGKFQFILNVPASATVGFHQEDYQLIFEGGPGSTWDAGGAVWLGVTVQ